MSENLPDIDDLFRKALDAHEESPSPGVWANIDKGLDKSNVLSILKKYQKLKWAAAALLIFSAGLAMYTWNTRIKNRELVKQSEVERKKHYKSGPQARNSKQPGTQKALIAVDRRGSATSLGSTGDAGTGRAVSASPQREPVLTHSADTPRDLKGIDQKTRKGIVVDKKDERLSQFNFEKGKLGNHERLLATASASRQKLPGDAGAIVDGGANERSPDATAAVSKGPAGAVNITRMVELGTAREDRPYAAATVPLPPLHRHLLSINNSFTENHDKTGSRFNKASVKPQFGSKWSATLFYSPDFVSTVVDNDRRAFREDDRNEIKNKEKITNTSRLGILVNYNLSKRWSLQSGLTFSTITTEIQPKAIFARPDDHGEVRYRFNCSAGFSYVTLKSVTSPVAGDSIIALSSKNRLKYLAVPFVLSYRLIDGKFSLRPGIGLTANFLTSGTIETSLAAPAAHENKYIDHIEGLTGSYVSGTFSLAANYNLSRHVALSLTPVKRVALSAINKDAPVKTYINSIGLAGGLTLSF